MKVTGWFGIKTLNQLFVVRQTIFLDVIPFLDIISLLVFILFTRWGKRAAHNRAQITYYMAENLELRREEFANKISRLTGKSMDEARYHMTLDCLCIFVECMLGKKL